MILHAVIWSALAASNIEAHAFDNVLKLLGFQTVHAHRLPLKSSGGLLVVPSNESLTPRELAAIRDYIRAGGDAIVTPEIADVKGGGDSIIVRDVTELSHPDRYLRWNPTATVARFILPASATLLLQDQPTHQPLAFCGTLGKGRYLALAAPFDTSSVLGTSRYPYFAEYLARAFDYQPAITRPAIEAYYDPAFGAPHVDEWQASGVRIIYAAAWQDIDYDKLIADCHAAGIAVYAWLVPPMISRKFWDDHPEWRSTRNGWRYPMNLEIPQARAAAFAWMHATLDRHEWDGVNFAELNLDNPLDNPPDNPANAAQVTALHRDILREFANPNIEVMITALDGFASPRLREAIGIDSPSIVALLHEFPFTLQVEDAFEHWFTPPDRYLQFARPYRKSEGSRAAMPAGRNLLFDVNVVPDRDIADSNLPSALAVGTEFAQLMHFASRVATNGRVAVYSVSTVPARDLALGAIALGSDATITGDRIHAPHSVMVHGTLEPAGSHPLLVTSVLRALSCELLSATDHGFEYESPGRCAFVLTKPVARIRVDGVALQASVLPRGRHHVTLENQ